MKDLFDRITQQDRNFLELTNTVRQMSQTQADLIQAVSTLQELVERLKTESRGASRPS